MWKDHDFHIMSCTDLSAQCNGYCLWHESVHSTFLVINLEWLAWTQFAFDLWMTVRLARNKYCSHSPENHAFLYCCLESWRIYSPKCFFTSSVKILPAATLVMMRLVRYISNNFLIFLSSAQLWWHCCYFFYLESWTLHSILR